MTVYIVEEGGTSIIWGRNRTDAPITVTWTAASGSATLGQDAHLPPAGSFIVNPGQYREFRYTIVDDGIGEGDEVYYAEVRWDGVVVDHAIHIIKGDTNTTPINVLRGGKGEDHFYPPYGSNVIDGAEGVDTVVYNGVRLAYKLDFKVTDAIEVTKSDGVDSLFSIEKIQFTDSIYNLQAAKAAASIDAATVDRLIDLYVAYFNRVPEADGLTYWINEYKSGKTIETITAEFYDAAVILGDFTGYSETMSLRDFIVLAYENVLSRTGDMVPEADVQWWINEIAQGRASREGLISRFLSDSRLFADDPEWYWMADFLDNKVELGRLHAITYGTDYFTQAEAHQRTVELTGLVTRDGISEAVAMMGLTSDNYIIA